MTREEIESRYERASEDYWTRHESTGFAKRIHGTPVDNPHGLDLFLHGHGLHGSAVSDGYTGLQIERCEEDADTDIEVAALEKITKMSMAVIWRNIGKGIETSGLSPRYRERKEG